MLSVNVFLFLITFIVLIEKKYNNNLNTSNVLKCVGFPFVV